MTRLRRTSLTFLVTAALLATSGLLSSPVAQAARGPQTSSVPTIYLDLRGGYYDTRDVNQDNPTVTNTSPAGALSAVNGDFNHETAAYTDIEVVDPLNPSNNFIDTGTPNKTGGTDYGEIRGRGNYTWKTLPLLYTPDNQDWTMSEGGVTFDSSQVTKRPYQIKLSSKRDILGMGSAKTWILLANHTDGSLMRNKVALDLALQLGLHGTPEARFVDLVLNGSYRGSYLLTEKVQEGGTRVDLGKIGGGTTPAGVLVEMDNNYYDGEPASLVYWAQYHSGSHFVLKDAAGSGGVPNKLNDGSLAPLSPDVQAGWDDIRSTIWGLENELYKATPDWNAISAMIDVDSFLKFYFVQEFTENPEVAKSSIYFYKAPGTKLYAGPVWDFDSSLGNYSDTAKGGNPNVMYARNILTYRPAGVTASNDWFSQLFRNPQFDAAAKTIYVNQVKQAVDESYSKTIHYENLMAASAAKNFAKWPILGGRKLFPPFLDSFSSTWQGEVAKLRSYIQKRTTFLNNYYAPGVASGTDCPTVAATAAITTAGAFNTLAPCRILDTRTGNGAPSGLVAPNGVVPLKVTGRGGIPATDVAAVVLNVTVANAGKPGFIVAYPSDVATAPMASNINYVAGSTVPNQVTVRVGPDGVVNLKSDSTGSVHLIADLAGYYVSGTAADPGAFSALSPARILDTREPIGAPQAPVQGGSSITFDVAAQGGVPAADVSAVVLNVTAVNPTADGHLTVYPADLPTPPSASNLNFTATQPPIANAVTVKLSPDGKLKVAAGGAGTVDVVADVAGYYLGGTPTKAGMYVPVTPFRALDSRSGTGMPKNDSFKAGTARMLNNFETIAVTVAGVGGVPTTAAVPTAGAVVMNVTVAPPTQPGFITVFPDGIQRPNSSSVNFVKGQVVPNLVTVKIGSGGKVDFYNMSAGQTHLIADLAGYFIK